MEAAAFVEEDGNFVWNRRGLEDDGAELAQRADQFGGQGSHGFDALNLGMKLRGGFEFEIGGGLVALAAQHDQAAFAARRKKLLNSLGFLPVTRVAAALVAGGEAHLHLGVDTAGMGGVGIKIVGAAAEEKKLEGLVREALGGGAGGERTVGP